MCVKRILSVLSECKIQCQKRKKKYRTTKDKGNKHIDMKANIFAECFLKICVRNVHIFLLNVFCKYLPATTCRSTIRKKFFFHFVKGESA